MSTPHGSGRSGVELTPPTFEQDGLTASRVLDVALEAAGMGAWRYRFDTSVSECSPAAQVLYGLSEAIFVRDDAMIERVLHPADREAARQALERAADPGGDGRYGVEYRVRRPEGGWRWLSVWGLVTFDHDCRPLTMIGASRDITGQKQAQMFLEAQKRSLELVVAGAPLTEVLTYLTRVVERQSDEQTVAAILLLDDDGRLRNGASPSLPAEYVAAIDGLKAEPHVGTCSRAAATRCTVVTPDIESDPGWAAIKHLPLNIGLKAAWSHPISARDGRVLGMFGTYFRTCREPSAAEREAVEILVRTAALAIERSRTDDALRESERKMRQDDQRKDEFLAALSHELRNPLAPLKTAIQLLGGYDKDQTHARLVATMQRQVDQLVRLVDDLLEVSRIRRGTLELREEQIDLATVTVAGRRDQPARDSRRRPRAVARRLGSRGVGQGRPRAPRADRLEPAEQRRQVHAVGRARHPARDSSRHRRPRVGRRRRRRSRPGDDPRAVRAVCPRTGAEYHNRDGLGVGLALARRLAEMHGGTLTGHSDGLGKGAEFTLRLPIAAPDAPRPPHGDTAPIRADRLRARVLVVDDNVDAADTTAQLLAQFGCETQSAYDARSALEMAAVMQPDVILLDIGLPDMTGYDLCRRMRREPWGVGARIVAVTGWGQERDRVQSGEAGFDAHAVKPVGADVLANLIALHTNRG